MINMQFLGEISSKEDGQDINKLFDILSDDLVQTNYESKTESYILKKILKKKKEKTFLLKIFF